MAKRVGYMAWDEAYMATALLWSMRSKDPSTQVGACIVNQKGRVVGIGYNGFPVGCDDNEFPWSNEAPDELDRKDMYVVHAEMNAIANATGLNLDGCKIYCTLFPCHNCAKILIQHGITEVVYLSDAKGDPNSREASKRMFRAAGVRTRSFGGDIEVSLSSRRFLP